MVECRAYTARKDHCPKTSPAVPRQLISIRREAYWLFQIDSWTTA